MERPLPSIVLLVTVHFVASCSTTNNAGLDSEAASMGAWDRGAMVSAAEPYAVDAAIEMLEKGGHAVDAAVAAHAVLGLVEPQSSGLGGSALLLVYERGSRELSYFDGRETAPAGATPEMFMLDGKVRSFLESWSSGISIGVPGGTKSHTRCMSRSDNATQPSVQSINRARGPSQPKPFFCP